MKMDTVEIHRYEFGEFVLEPESRKLLRNGKPVPLTPKALDTLLILVRNSGQIVSKEALLNQIWPDAFVEEATLSQNIFTIRRALGQRPDGAQFIETVPKYGYRFVAPLREANTNGEVILERHSRTQIFTQEINEDSADALRETSAHVTSDVLDRPVSDPHFRLLTARNLVAATVVTATMIATLLVIRSMRAGRQSNPGFSFAGVSKITSRGNVSRVAISPNGAYIVYSARQGGRESLWLKQMGATREIELAPPAETAYRGVGFSPDSASIYYARYDKTANIGELYRSPALGGPAAHVLSDIDSAVAFSPDGKRLCFFRNSSADSQSSVAYSTSLIMASADGSEQRTLATYPAVFMADGPAWSPDGRAIVYPITRNPQNQERMALVAYNLDTGQQNALTSDIWGSIEQVSWMAEGNALLFDGWNDTLSSSQLWQLSYPAGQLTRLTNDLNTYAGAAFAGNTLVTTESDRVAALWVARDATGQNATQITFGAGDKGGEYMGLSWTPDGKLVYGSTESGQPDIWTVNADGTNKAQLTAESQANLRPSIANDGTIAFVSRRTGDWHIWLMNNDGSNQRQLQTEDRHESQPSFFPDGKSLVYVAYERGLPKLWKTSDDGKQKSQLTSTWATRPVVSPDGKLIACLYTEEMSPFRHVAIIPESGGQPLEVFELTPDTAINVGFHWTPDGQSIAYVRNTNGVSNIWTRPIHGKEAQQLTHFTSNKIFRFAWSTDGSKLAMERGEDMQDVVVIRRAT
jgi:Tol biopolymer transport system component/DNA-binding winged helix-turn-helix (wHTH) protein